MFFLIYGFVTALITVAPGYFDYYKSVIATVESKQGYVTGMVAVGLVVFAIAMSVCYLTRNVIRLGEKIPAIFPLAFAGALALIPVGTPYALSLLSAGRFYWLTPTIMGNALIVQYVVYILVMIFGGLSLGTMLRRPIKTPGASAVSMPVLFLLTAVTAFLMLTVIPGTFGWDVMWPLLAAFTAVCSVISMIVAPGREK